MPRSPSINSFQVALRIPKEWIHRADQLIDSLSRPGIEVTRTDVLRAALIRGLNELTADAEGKRAVR